MRFYYSHKPGTNQTTSWLVHNRNTFGAWMSHGHTRTHKTHHGPDLGEATTFPPYNILCVWPQGQHLNVILFRDSQVGVPKFPKLGLLWLWRPITLCVDFRLRWGLKQNCNPHWEFANGMWHIICTQGNQGHKFCFKYSNGSCEPILDI
jgi:hypothetical protein